jgi:hypothetical protein
MMKVNSNMHEFFFRFEVRHKFQICRVFSPQSVGVRGQVAAGIPRCPPYGRPLRRVAAAAHRRRSSEQRDARTSLVEHGGIR